MRNGVSRHQRGSRPPHLDQAVWTDWWLQLIQRTLEPIHHFYGLFFECSAPPTSGAVIGIMWHVGTGTLAIRANGAATCSLQIEGKLSGPLL